jgi:hypothetical protein
MSSALEVDFSDLSADRISYDQCILDAFVSESSGIYHHLKFSHSVKARFSTFTCVANFCFGSGVCFSFSFDDYAEFVFAAKVFDRDGSEEFLKRNDFNARSFYVFFYWNTSCVAAHMSSCLQKILDKIHCS